MTAYDEALEVAVNLLLVSCRAHAGEEFRPDLGAAAMNENVDTTDLALDLIEQRVRLFRSVQVARDEPKVRGGKCRAQLLENLCASIGITAVDDNGFGTALCQ